MKALDIVEIDTGAVGMVLEGDENSCSIAWFGGKENKTAWWRKGEKGLKVIDNLPAILAENVRNTFSSDKRNPYSTEQ